MSGTEAGAVKAGSANLIATYGGKTAEATLNVLANSLISLAVTPETVNLKVGESCELSVIGTYSDGTQKDNAADAVYVPEDPVTELITVSANGVITAQAEGSISLVVRYKGITKEVAITITQAAE